MPEDAELRDRLAHAVVFAEALARTLREALKILDEQQRAVSAHQLPDEEDEEDAG